LEVFIEIPPFERWSEREEYREARRPSFGFLFFFLFFLDDSFFGGFLFFFLFLIFVIGNGDQVDRMSLSDFEFSVTLVAAQDFAFFHFVFVEINFGVAFWTSRHGFLSLMGPASACKRII
jgi:hypothetical protein